MVYENTTYGAGLAYRNYTGIIKAEQQRNYKERNNKLNIHPK